MIKYKNNIKFRNKILLGNAIDVLKQIPPKSIDTVVTSPPYWGLREYSESHNFKTEDIADKYLTETTKKYNKLFDGKNVYPIFSKSYNSNDKKWSIKCLFLNIWDGDPDCEHEFDIRKTIIKSTYNKDFNERYGGGAGQRKQEKSQQLSFKDGFCKKCGAWMGSLGLEQDFNQYIKDLCNVFDEVKRVLKDSGSVFVNLGDTYGSHTDWRWSDWAAKGKHSTVRNSTKGYKKCLLGIPERFMLEMIDNRGWTLRSKIVWVKTNSMPSSVKDNFAPNFEYIYFFVKNKKNLWYINKKSNRIQYKKPLGIRGIEGIDWDWKTPTVNLVQECKTTKIPIDLSEHVSSPRARKHRKPIRKKVSYWSGTHYYFEKQYEPLLDSSIRGRGMRCVWTIPTQPFKGAHFATFPEKLIETPIRASCPQYICSKCGLPREKIYKKGNLVPDNPKYKPRGKYHHKLVNPGMTANGYDKPTPNFYYEKKQISYSNCGCNAKFVPGIVLDPFMGSGTTALVAKKMGRDFCGIELIPQYIEIAFNRLGMYKNIRRIETYFDRKK